MTYSKLYTTKEMTRLERAYAAHLRKIEASEILAQKAEKMAIEKGVTYDQAVDYILKTDKDLADIYVSGYTSEPAREYDHKASLEAGNVLADRAMARMKKEKLTYSEAFDKETKADPALFKTYTQCG